MNEEKVTFINSRNLKLSGIFYNSPIDTKSVVITCHGLSGTKSGGGKAIDMGKELNRKGWSVFLFDFTGLGDSEGIFEEMTLTRQIDDLTCAVDWCVGKGFKRIVTQGRSFGGTTAICQAAADKRVKGVCTWSAPAQIQKLILRGKNSADEIKGDYVILGQKPDLIYLKKSFIYDVEKYDVTALSPMISPRPFLVIQGTADLVVPPTNATTIYNSAGWPKELVFIEGANHEYNEHYKKVWEAFFNWLAKEFPG
ncbi:MAG: Hydrolase [Desulfotomaculum sp. 46_80]|nr:MAG: Hydrolase [Desulfotomaculum sp. 46_80]